MPEMGKVGPQLYQTLPINSVLSRSGQPDGVCLYNTVQRIDMSTLKYRYSSSLLVNSIIPQTQVSSVLPSFLW